METAVRAAFPFKEGKPNFIRYADDFVVLHPTEEGVIKARAILEAWLKDMGLELKPSKTRITHTLRKYQGTVGFDFLGFTVRQFPVGKTHSGRPGGMGKNARLGFKTIIKPSKEAIKQHLEQRGVSVADFGASSKEPTDYPDFAQAVARSVAERRTEFGVLVCTTGVGMSIAANKIPGVRAALAHDEVWRAQSLARKARQLAASLNCP